MFPSELDHFRANGGPPPRCSITLCFGEELSAEEDLTKKLITVQVTPSAADSRSWGCRAETLTLPVCVQIWFPWAEQQVESAQPLASPLISLLQTLSESPLGEITLNLVSVPADGMACASVWDQQGAPRRTPFYTFQRVVMTSRFRRVQIFIRIPKCWTLNVLVETLNPTDQNF